MRVSRFFPLAALAVLVALAPATESAARVKVGQPAPDLVWNSVEGDTLNWDELGGNGPVVLLFWATWCSSCKKEWPEMQALAAEYAGSPLRFASVAVDKDPAKVGPTLGERGPIGASLVDPGEKNSEILGLKFVPTVLVLDGERTVRYFGEPKTGKLRKLLDSVREPTPNTGDRP